MKATFYRQVSLTPLANVATDASMAIFVVELEADAWRQHCARLVPGVVVGLRVAPHSERPCNARWWDDWSTRGVRF